MQKEAQRYRYICEVCGRTETLTSMEAMKRGWDYPPYMGEYGIISPRTCCDCSIMDTVWFAIELKGLSWEKLTTHQIDVIKRIKGEPDNMLFQGGLQ